MTSQSQWTQDKVLEHLKQRTLDSTCPPLIAHLYPGANVLDLGCGSGGISLDIAARIHPATLTGVDREAKSIEQARAFAQERGIDNATFVVGDAAQPELADGTFDITLGVNILPYLRDLPRVLAEWRRVTRPGGKVITNLGDRDAIIYYPTCPARKKCDYTEILHNWGEEYLHLGPHGVEMFARAGLQNIKVEVYSPPEFLIYPGGTRFEFMRQHLGGPVSERYRAIIDAGLLDVETAQAADREGEAWLAHPYAFYSQMLFLVSGNVS